MLSASLYAVDVRIEPALPPGRMVRMDGAVYVRHMTEMMHALAGAPWHVVATGCPTWTPGAECQCMTEVAPC